MTKVLLTGMSGVGKSTILGQLNLEGHKTVDLDYDDWIKFDNQADDYLMNSKKIIDLIEQNDYENLFIGGTTINQKEIYPYLDYIIALTAPIEVMKKRIQIRNNNPFGKNETDWNKILKDKEMFEPLIIKNSDFVIDTNKNSGEIVNDIYKLIGLTNARKNGKDCV